MKDREVTIQATAVVHGPQFNRIIGEIDGIPVRQSRQGMYVVGIGDDNSVYYIDYDECPVLPGDLPVISITDEEALFDNTFVEGPDRQTIRKGGYSRPTYKIKEQGDPNYKITKPDSSFRFGHPSSAGRKRK